MKQETATFKNEWSIKNRKVKKQTQHKVSLEINDKENQP